MRKYLVSILVLGLLFFSGAVNGTAKASAWYWEDDFSTDTGWWNNEFFEGPAANNMGVGRQNNRLEFSATGVPADTFGAKGKMFYAPFNLGSNLQLKADMHYSSAVDGGIVGVMSVWSGQPGDGPPLATLLGSLTTYEGSKSFSFSRVDSQESIEVVRTVDDATFWGHYVSADDRYDFAFMDGDTVLASNSIEDFTATFPGVTNVSVGIGGFSGGGDFIGSEAYADNFAATPEPVSSVLFLIGGTSLIVARLRKRK